MRPGVDRACDRFLHMPRSDAPSRAADPRVLGASLRAGESDPHTVGTDPRAVGEYPRAVGE